MKTKLVLFVILMAITAIAENASTNAVNSKTMTKAELEARQARIAQLGGGYVDRPGTPKGRIVIFDCQKDFSPTNVPSIIDVLGKDFKKFDIVSTIAADPKGDFAGMKQREKADVAIFIVSDETTPSLLQAPDDGWIALNVKKLGRNLLSDRARDRFLLPRYRKQLIRAVVLACGGAGSTFAGNAMDVAKIEDLDLVSDEFVPYDKFDICERYLHNLGLKERQRVVYRRACREGWAPAPTNDVQKAIWEKVHTPPEKPMKIKFDSEAKKGTVIK